MFMGTGLQAEDNGVRFRRARVRRAATLRCSAGAPEMPGISDARLATVAGPSAPAVAGSTGRLSASQRAHDRQGPRARAAKHEQVMEAVCSRLVLPTCISDAAKRIC